jgi:ADP-heptose:LPS heptosyltransferase
MVIPTIIGSISPTQAGDSVCSLVAARYIKKIFPNSYSVAVLDPRTKELAPLLINHPDIDRICISQKQEGYTDTEKQWASAFDYNLPLFGHYVPDNWGKTMNWVERNFRIRFQFESTDSKLSVIGWNTLTKEEKMPMLTPWFNVNRLKKTIVISPFVGYNLSDETTRTRSPSMEWWINVVEMITKMGFNVVQIGLPNLPLIKHDKVNDKRELSLLESVKLALGADIFFGACGGMQFIINSYGHKTICPFTNWVKDAKPEVLLPVNYKNNMIPLYSKDDVNLITLEKVEKAILQF